MAEGQFTEDEQDAEDHSEQQTNEVSEERVTVDKRDDIDATPPRHDHGGEDAEVSEETVHHVQHPPPNASSRLPIRNK